MRLIGNARLRRFRLARTPMEICPGRAIWERHRNREYLVFLDESFYHFFGFVAPDGNFCHGAVGVPVENYPRLQELFAPTVRAYCRQVHRATGVVADEIKFRVLRALPLHFRLKFTRELVRCLADVGGFIAGFYTPTRGAVMEKVRTTVLNEADEVPVDHTVLYATIQQELRTAYRGNGQRQLIERLLLTPFSSIWSVMHSFDCVFRVRYDPRQEAEDQAVRQAIADFMGRLVNVPEIFGARNIFLGMQADISERIQVFENLDRFMFKKGVYLPRR